MDTDVYFAVNEPNVTFESFDSEVLAINLRNGSYYSLRESAVPIWLLLAQGVSLGAVTRALTDSCSCEDAHVTSVVRAFIDELVASELILRLDGTPPKPANPAPVPLPTKFVTPVLDCYTDMQQLLLMDPIHEVDVTGWPTKAPTKDSH